MPVSARHELEGRSLAIATAPPTKETETDGEQRRVTLMFADISGSTELVEHLDPEAAANLLDPLIGVMTDTVERYAGQVSPRGDGILAMFGVAGSSEDNTVRACFAALEILRRLDGVGPRVRIGIHHGEVALLAGRRGPSRENFFGPAIHAAARLEQSAEPGSICLSTEAYELARDFVTAEPLPPAQVKGLSEPLERFRLVGVRTASRWRARLGRGLTPVVDRLSELAACAAFLRDAANPGVHLLQILGQAGVGKSRLVHEVLRTEDARRRRVITLTGPVHRAFAGYDPLAHWLHDLALDAGGAGQPRELIARLPGAATFSSDEAEQLIRYLGLRETARVDIGEQDTETRLNVEAPIASVVATMAGGRPVILSCEDAETLDRGRLDHLAAVSAAISARGPPVLLLVSSRRALRLPARLFATRKTLRLQALARDDARQLLARAHPRLNRRSKLIEPILAKAGGNPLFIEEVAALLLANPEKQGSDDDLAGAIPDRIEALIADRLDRLPREAQTLLRVCSVLGSTFSPDMLAAVSGQSAGALKEQLTKLLSEQLLYEGPGASGPLISFDHSLVRDVAYRTLLSSKRRAVHQQALRLLEASEPPVDPATLAHHAVNARMWPEALFHSRRAAVAAAGRADYPAAEQHSRQALKVAAMMPEDLATRGAMVDVMVGLRSILALDLRHEEADQLLDRAQELAGDLEPERRLSIMVKRVRTLNTRGSLRQALAVATEAQRGASAIGHIPLQIAAMHFLGQTHYYMGRFGAGEATLSAAAELTRAAPGQPADIAVGDPPVLVLAMRGLTRAFLGQFPDAERDVEQAMAIAAARDSAYDVSFAQLASGAVRLHRRDLEAAEDKFRIGLGTAERHQLRALQPLLNVGLGHALLLGGSSNAAIAALSEAHEVARDAGRVLSQVWAATGLAAAQGGTGGLVPALRYAEEAVALGARHTLRGFLIGALRAKGALLASQDETREAGIRAIQQALALARKLGARPDIAHCLAALAAVSGAGAHAREAASLYRSLGMHAWADRVLGAGMVPLSIIAG